ncbi:MAG: FAD-dependent oxidoreductase, partial [Candidatus Diapherotrites archaeon]
MQKILILGGGFAGIETALRLRQYLSKNEIILVSDDDCFTFSPLLYEVAAGELSEADTCLLIPSLLKKYKIVYYHDSVKKILPKEKFVITKNSEKISFDVLILAIGALTNYSGIEGKEKAFALKSKEDAEKLFERISNCVEKNEPHDFVVCGAGLTGIELATTLKDHLDIVCAKNGFNRKNFRVTILHGPNRILPNLPDKASSLVLDYLSKASIDVVCNFYTKKIFNKKVISRDGSEFRCDTLIWAGGIRTHDLIIESSLPYSGMLGERGAPGGGLLVNSFMQCTTYP